MNFPEASTLAKSIGREPKSTPVRAGRDVFGTWWPSGDCRLLQEPRWRGGRSLWPLSSYPGTRRGQRGGRSRRSPCVRLRCQPDSIRRKPRDLSHHDDSENESERAEDLQALRRGRGPRGLRCERDRHPYRLERQWWQEAPRESSTALSGVGRKNSGYVFRVGGQANGGVVRHASAVLFR